MKPQETHDSVRRGTLFVLALILITAALAGFAAPAQAGAPATSTSTARFETRFMMDMIDHHAMAVHMAEMCLEIAIHEELEATCQEIIATQSTEIELMQTRLADWYGIAYEPEMNHGMMKQMEKMAAMSSEEFEIHFMEEMIRHHQGAIREAEQCLRRAYHTELFGLCQDIVETQRAEIEQMAAWLWEWYDVCRYVEKA